MTIERVFGIVAHLDEFGRNLVADIASAGARAEAAEPGERSDVIRFEALSSQLEAWAFATAFGKSRDGAIVVELDSTAAYDTTLVAAPSPLPEFVPADARVTVERALADGAALIVVVAPLEAGTPSSKEPEVPAPPAAQRWEDPKGRSGTAAVRERFNSQLRRAVTAAGAPEPINPSGIANRALTESLWDFVARGDATAPVAVPVEYRDGSRATNPFVMRSLDLVRNAEEVGETLSFALLSIRHTELDAIVDGAWLRNTQISQTRTQADTDDLVYSISRKQLDALTDGGAVPITLKMYQTGLEPAIVGFYRAVVDHLLAHPHSLAVLPMYFQQPPKASPAGDAETRRRKGKQQSPQRAPGDDRTAKAGQDTTYAPGLAWATSSLR